MSKLINKKVERGEDGRLWFYNEAGTHKMTYIIDVDKGLNMNSPLNPIVVRDPYVKNTEGPHNVWVNIKDTISRSQLTHWERAIWPLELARLEGGDK